MVTEPQDSAGDEEPEPASHQRYTENTPMTNEMITSKRRRRPRTVAGAGTTPPQKGHLLDLGFDLGEGRRIRSTTVICVRRGDTVVMAADGQVSLGSTVMKHSAKKIRKLYQDKVLAGFAGSTADAFSLFARFETKLEQYAGNLGRAAVELAKDWRTDKMLRQLEALLIVTDAKQTFLLSGNGDVIDPDEGIAVIGSGGPYALAASRALMDNTQMSAREIAEKSLLIAGQICLYTNDHIMLEELKAE